VQNLVAGTTPEVKECIVTLFEYIDSMTTSIHRIRTTLKPLLLDELGLVASIELLSEQISEKSGILIDVDCPCLLCRSAEDSLHVFKIAHEVLANCVKHSQATHITIACVKLHNECLLEISDNGIGFVCPDASNIKSFGLVGMKERADLLGARLDIRSVVHKGTVVSLYIPCKQKKGAMNAISHSR
jgi:two-component system sensor histidine kinase UhpB